MEIEIPKHLRLEGKEDRGVSEFMKYVRKGMIHGLIMFLAFLGFFTLWKVLR